MAALFELYFEDNSGDIHHCGDFYDEQEVLRQQYSLSYEFPENSYYYEIVDDGQ